MLLALAVLGIGGAVLFTGPVEAVVENFNRTGIRTTMDSLCPNTTYTFLCEISGTMLRLTSFDRNGAFVDIFNAGTGTDVGEITSRSEFDFTRINSTTGLAAIAVMNSSIDLSSVELECRDVNNMTSKSLSTDVKHPLDATNFVFVTSAIGCDNTVSINVIWEPVDCAQSYVLTISDMDSITTNETSYETSFDEPVASISGRIVAEGGLARDFNGEFSTCSYPTSTTPPSTSPVPGFGTSPVCNSRCCGKTETGYNITFIEFPDGGTAYYETSDGSVVNIDIMNDVATIFPDSNVTVYVTEADGTLYYSQELEAPSVPGRHFCCLWFILAIVLLVILCVVLCAFAIVMIVKKCCGDPKVANQGNVDLAHESEMKTVQL